VCLSDSDTRQLCHRYGQWPCHTPSSLIPGPPKGHRRTTYHIDPLTTPCPDKTIAPPEPQRLTEAPIRLGCTWIIPRPVAPPSAPIAIVIHPQCLRIHLKQSMQRVLALSTPLASDLPTSTARPPTILPTVFPRVALPVRAVHPTPRPSQIHLRKFLPFSMVLGACLVHYLVLLEKPPAIKISCTSVRCVQSHSRVPVVWRPT